MSAEMWARRPDLACMARAPRQPAMLPPAWRGACRAAKGMSGGEDHCQRDQQALKPPRARDEPDCRRRQRCVEARARHHRRYARRLWRHRRQPGGGSSAARSSRLVRSTFRRPTVRVHVSPTYVRLLLTYLYRRYGIASPNGVLDGAYAPIAATPHARKGEISISNRYNPQPDR